jgi:hypothetical protein
MTKKHFIQLAQLLKSLKPETTNGADYALWVDFVSGMASFCSGFNGRFDRSRFLSACGLERY